MTASVSRLIGKGVAGPVMTRFEVTTSEETDHVRVALAGECDLAVREELTVALLAAVRRAPVVVVDVGGLDFLDSSGVHGLITAHHAARDTGRKLFVVNPRGSVAAVLDLTGVAGLLTPPTGNGPSSSTAGDSRLVGPPAGDGPSGSVAGDGGLVGRSVGDGPSGSVAGGGGVVGQPAGDGGLVGPSAGDGPSGSAAGDGSLVRPPAGDGVQG